MDLATLVGALPDLGSLGIALVLITLDRRWFSAERTEWRAERAALLAEAAAARAELATRRPALDLVTAPVPVVGRHGLRSSPSAQSG
jgi:hypothetical protein